MSRNQILAILAVAIAVLVLVVIFFGVGGTEMVDGEAADAAAGEDVDTAEP